MRNFKQVSVPLNGALKNNRRDKFWTDLGFGAFMNAVRGRKVRNPRANNFLIARCKMSSRPGAGGVVSPGLRSKWCDLGAADVGPSKRRIEELAKMIIVLGVL